MFPANSRREGPRPRTNDNHLKWLNLNPFSLLLFVLLLICSSNFILVESASFYGQSYIKLPFREYNESTRIEFRFKTHQPNAFLFLAAGSSDYCLLYLEYGQLAVKINFGSGETYLTSDGEAMLNDLQWHHVQLERIDTRLLLKIDDQKVFISHLKLKHEESVERTALNGGVELKILYGIFLGSQNNFKGLYLGDMKPLRGCLDEVYFNHKNILDLAAISKQAIFHEVSTEDGCDDEFNHYAYYSNDSSITFAHQQSFVLLPGLEHYLQSSNNHHHNLVVSNQTSTPPLTVEFDLKTISLNAMLLFNPGKNPYKKEYFIVEIINNQLKTSISDGIKENVLHSSMSINDSHWHHVQIQWKQNGQLVINVDARRDSTAIQQHPIQLSLIEKLSNELYVGGLSSERQSLAVNYGIQSTLIEQNVSLKGCLKNIKINSKVVTLIDAMATKQIMLGKCRWQFLCSDQEKSPCIRNAQCQQKQINLIECSCYKTDCVRKNFKKHKSLSVESKTIEPNNELCNEQHKEKETQIDVLLGSSAIINNHLIKLINKTTWNIQHPPIQWKMMIKQKPIYGSIHTDLDQEPFDWNALNANNIKYTASNQIANYNQQDLMTMLLETFDDQGQCRQYSLKVYFRIHSLVDDAPERQTIQMKILADHKFVLPANLFKLSTTDSIVAKKKNKDEHFHKFKVIRMNHCEQCYLENVYQPSTRLEQFTENDLKNSSIQFVHRSSDHSNRSIVEIIFHVSEENKINKKFEKELHLILKPYRINKNELINTGLLMTYHTHSLITSSNLSLSIDDQQQDKDITQLIRFELVNMPKYGLIQKLRLMPNNWNNVTQFTQRQLERGKIRYLHLNGQPSKETLKIRILFNKQLIRTIDFNVSFVAHLEIVQFGSNVYNFSKNEKEFIMTGTELSFQTRPVLSNGQAIQFTLQSVPSYGTLYLLAKNTLQKTLKIGSHFTQRDVDERRILYVRNNSFINIDSIRDLVDGFQFNVSLNNNANVNKIASFYVYFDNSLENYVLINRKLTVLEGDKSLIDENHLYLRSIEMATDSQIKYNEMLSVEFEIIEQPKFGTIQIDGQTETNPKRIPQKWIQQKKVYYIHDDSENNLDFFDFLVRSFSSDNNNGQLIKGKFSIEILMKNDNAPIRIVNKKLNIIKNSERLLNNGDISYMDYDLNTWPSNIVFNKIYSPIGLFVFVTNGSIVERFTQQDIDDGLIMFRHNGTDEGKASFTVTDGQFILSESLEIKASEPYISIQNNTGAIVKYGETCVITSKNLSIETNLPDKNEIFIKLLTEPRFGQIIINDKSTIHFTLKELEDDFVEYESTIFEDESPFSRNDSFEFRVFSNNAQYKELVSKSNEFTVRIFPQNYFNMNIVHLKNLTMFEESRALIDSKHLLMEHSELKPWQIVYTITKKFRFGLIKNIDHQTLNEVISFTQQDINNGKIIYQNIKQDDDYSDENFDWFQFEVGDDIFKLTELTFYIELIPKFITLSTSNLTVTEGNLTILTREHIHLTHPYYTRFVDEFIVVEEPKYGTISLIGPENVKLSAKLFTGKQLDDGKICYQHDSSEFEKDWFTIVARANSIEKESLPATIHITVASINDEAPVLVNLNDIDVWKDEMVQITNASLSSIDQDSKPAEILYLISMPMNGYLINIDTNVTIDKFTQADINNGKIYFVHVGSGNGSFRFHVTDGKNYGNSNIFKIKVKFKKINIDINQKLLVSPRSQQSITQGHLQVSSSEQDENREFIYRIMKAPTYGRIILEGFKQQQQQEISFFTQQQLNENQVLYDQNVSLNDESIVLDRIIFNIESADMPTLKSVHFLVEIASDNIIEYDSTKTETDSLIPIEPLTVIEGKFNAITMAEMNLKQFLSKLKYNEQQVLLKITKQPIHGIVLRNGLILDNLALFPTSAIRNRSIVYLHDDSNTFTDSISFSLYTNENLLISILNLTLPIRIVPVNDEFPVLVNRNPRLQANYGTKTLITKETLQTRDYDGNDTKIVYLFRSDNMSKEGFISKHDFKDIPIHYFTQQDINEQKIYFVHQGPKTEFLFWFRVRDDDSVMCSNVDDVPQEINYEQLLTSAMVNSHCTPYYPFSIMVNRHSIQVINQTSIQLYQGSKRTLITNSNLAVKNDLDSDGQQHSVIYRIRKGPFYGHISVDNKRSLHFTQKQINEHQVYYVQDNPMLREDSFTLDLYEKANDRIMNNVNIKIIIVPLVRARKPFLAAFPGQKSLLTAEHIDASELALKTESNPKFKIIQNPHHGTFSLLQFGENNFAEPISEFSQEDIIQNRVVYLANANIEQSYPNEILIDIMEYELSASNVQNAYGILVINIFTNQSDDLNNLFIKNNYLSYLGMTLMKEQFFILFFLILFLLLLIPTIIIIVRMCLLSWSDKSNSNPNKCPKNYVAQTLTTCHHHQQSSSQSHTDHSSVTSSSRPTNDSVSHYSSSTTFDHSIHDANCALTKTPFQQKQFENINLKVLKKESNSLKKYKQKKYTRDEMSPLPPPSLYFINDQSFINQQWDKAAIDSSTMTLNTDKSEDNANHHCLVEANEDVIHDDDDDDNEKFQFPLFGQQSQRKNDYHQQYHIPPPLIDNDELLLMNNNHKSNSQNKLVNLTTENGTNNVNIDGHFKNQYWI